MPTFQRTISAIGRWLRRMVLGLGTMTLILGLSTFVGRFFRGGIDKNSVLHVTLDGALREGPSGPVAALTGNRHRTSLVELTHKIRSATDDPRIVGLFLEIKEPMLGMAQLSEVARAFDAFHASNKPTWSYMETAGEQSRGDGVLALSTLAKTSHMPPSGMVSLFGMRTDVPFAKGVFDKLHLDVHVEKRHEYKSFGDTFTEKGFTAPNEEATRSLLGDLQESYLGFVGSRRKQDPSAVKRWILGAPYSATEAQAQGLIDKVAYRDEVMADIEKVATRADALVEVDAYAGATPKSSQKRVALVMAAGEISRGDSGLTPFGESDGIGSDTYTEALRDARDDEVDGILVRIDSPGGSYLASDLVRRELVLARQQNIPVVVSMGDVAASGGYFIASAADHIVAEAGTITGSIGVVSVSFAIRRTLEDFFGLRFGTIETLPHAGAPGFLDLPNADEKKVLAGEIDRIYKDFVDKVADARHQSYSQIHEVARGRVWTGRQALAHGLVDEIGGFDAALGYLRKRLNVEAEEPLTLLPYPEPSSPWEVLRDALANQATLARVAATHKSTLRRVEAWLSPWLAKTEGAQAHL